jgi:ribosomal protein L32
MISWRDLFGNNREKELENSEVQGASTVRDIREDMNQSILLLEDADGTRGSRLQREAEKEAKSAAESSVKRLRVAQMGRCPKCGETLRKHLFAALCPECGWHTFDTPKNGPVRVYLREPEGIIEGQRCYSVKGGMLLVLRDEMVVAKIPRHGYSRVEYLWNAEEVAQHHQEVTDRLVVSCGWCNKPAVPAADGFHLVHIAFGSSQERFCFCSDDCYEAFRRMYPARTHRDCYDRACETCDLCIKRYDDHSTDLRKLGKDYILTSKPERSPGQNRERS